MQEWISTTNIYEVNLRQYTPEGTINAFTDHLPRLKDMGVETLWFMPITPISQLNRKGSMGSYYACSDYTSVALEFGSLEDFKTLVYQAHAMGMKVILDWVANHTGWDHWWTVEHPDWYEKDEHTGDFKKASGMDDIIELDFKNPALRKAMIEAMKFWVTETDIDGFRCDLAFWVELDFWIEAKPELEKIKPLFWLGEMDPLDNPDYMQVFDAAYTWKWMHKTEQFYKGQAPFGDLLSILDQYQGAPGTKAWFTTNHDENTWNGTEYEKYGELAKALAVFGCTWPGVPLIYSGQELPNHKRLQFFEKDVIEWRSECELHTFYKTLFALKQTNPALSTDAELNVLMTDGNQQLLVFRRWKEKAEVVVAINFSRESRQVFLPQISN
ncbi:MAG TPA: alpha-amylase family glycosyl hydrolase, partial [Flavisolibacter sp.]